MERKGRGEVGQGSSDYLTMSLLLSILSVVLEMALLVMECGRHNLLSPCSAGLGSQ
jgi:hypothetical protein